jgi:hypothetical protein
MSKLYVIRRVDWFDAIKQNQIPENTIREFGQIWIVVYFNQEQRENYKFPIDLA